MCVLNFAFPLPNSKCMLSLLQEKLQGIDPSYPEELEKYEQSKVVLQDSTYSETLEALFATKLLYIAYQGFHWNLDCFQQPVNKLRISTDYEDLHQEMQLANLSEVVHLEKVIHTAHEAFSADQQEAAAQIGDYYAYLETVGFKIAHYWGFLWGNTFYSQVIPGYVPDRSFTSQYAHMIERDLGMVIQQK